MEQNIDLNAFPYVIAGSGLLGSVLAERIASQLDRRVLVIEKRGHIGGNCFSEEDTETGIEYHRYGTHIFHTSNEKVWNYVNRFVTFNTYRHQVLTSYQNRMYQFPINLETINTFYNVNLRPYEVDAFMAGVRQETFTQPANFEEQAIALLGRDLYEAFFKHYTFKQWQLPINDKTHMKSMTGLQLVDHTINFHHTHNCYYQLNVVCMIGPSSNKVNGGRTRSLLVQNTSPHTLYAGAVAGGVCDISNAL